mgnify:CR=1 FL=1
MALGFLSKWGCEVYAFTSSDSKHDEAKRLGAHQVINSRDSAQMAKIAGALDFVLVTVNVPPTPVQLTLDMPTPVVNVAPAQVTVNMPEEPQQPQGPETKTVKLKIGDKTVTGTITES